MKKIRKNIIKNSKISYFDFTASGLAYKSIEKKINKILKTYGNTHSEVSSTAVMTAKFCENSRKNIRKCLQISDNFYLFPCGTGASGAIKKFQEIIGIYMPPMTKQRCEINIKQKPLVIVGPYEHHSNEISFREGFCDVVRIGLDEHQNVDLVMLEKVLNENKNKEIIASFSVASNVTGVRSEYKKIYTLVKKFGGILALDCAAASPYLNVDCEFYDALFLSPHKLLGGPGSCGLLVLRKNLYKNDKPTFAGGGTVSYVSRKKHSYLDDVEMIEDAGTPGILQLIRASLAYELRNKIGLKKIQKKEKKLKKYFCKKIQKIKNLTLYSSINEDDLPIFSFNIKDIHHEKLSLRLSDVYNIQTRAGCSCAGPFGHDLLNLCDGQSFSQKPGWLRVSIHYTHTKKEIDMLIFAIKDSIKVLKTNL